MELILGCTMVAFAARCAEVVGSFAWNHLLQLPCMIRVLISFDAGLLGVLIRENCTLLGLLQ